MRQRDVCLAQTLQHAGGWLRARGARRWPLRRAPAAADFRLCNNTGEPGRRRDRLQGRRRAGPPKAGGTCRRAPAKPCSRALWSRATIISTPSTTTAAANGRDRPTCAPATRSSPSAASSDCLARGFDRTGFFEVDTGEQRAWTVQLTESAEQPAAAAVAAGQSAAQRAACRRRRDIGARDREYKADETAAPHQGRRHAGSRLVGSRRDRRLFEAGADVFRINMSHTDRMTSMRELVGDDPRGRGRSQPADRHPGRSAGSEAAARRASRTAPPMLDKAQDLHARHRRRRPATPRACTCRIRKSSPRIKPGHALLLDDGKMRLVATEVSAATHRDARRGRRQAVRPQGRQPARHRHAVRGADAQGSSPISKPRSTPASTGSRCRSSSGPKTSPRPRRSRAAAPR